MFLLVLTVNISWVIWTFLKCWRRDWLTPKQERLTTPVLRFGRTSLTIWKAIFGLWAVLSTRCVPWNLPSRQLTFNLCTKRSKLVFLSLSPPHTPLNFLKWSTPCLNYGRRTDLPQISFWSIPALWEGWVRKVMWSKLHLMTPCLALLNLTRSTSRPWKVNCPRLVMKTRV